MCEKCGDSGWITYEKEGMTYAKHCECREVTIAKSRLEASGVSEEFLKRGFKDFETKGNKELEYAKNVATEYYMRFNEIELFKANSILFSGQVGAGKTHLSMAICNNLMNFKNVSVLYMPYRESIMKLKQSASDELNYAREINKYKNARVLLIDDLFKGGITQADLNAMFEIINFRYLNNKPMVISTEKTKEQLINIDEGIASRIYEMAREYTVVFDDTKLNHRLYG